MLRERVRMLKAQIAGAHGATQALARQLAQVAAAQLQTSRVAVRWHHQQQAEHAQPRFAPASTASGTVSADAQASRQPQ